MIDLALQFLLAVIPAVVAITLHEAAHGYAALALGDDTAQRMGRLSLNPLRHVDRVGTILLPGALLLGQLLTIGRVSFMFGWAKPVPVSAGRFADPRRGMMLVAAAGPAMNFALAWLGALALHGIGWLPDGVQDDAISLIQLFMLANLVLGLFNLLPIPPLDGGRIVVGLLPERWAMGYARLEGAGIVLVLFVVFLLPLGLAEFGVQFDPVGTALGRSIPWMADVVFRLAFHHV